MKYHWTSRNLRRDLRELQNLAKKEADGPSREKLYEYISQTKSLILNLEHHGLMDDILSGTSNPLDYLALVAPDYELYYPFLRDFKRKMSSFVENLELRNRIGSNLSLSKEDMVELVHEFFKSTNQEYFSLYQKLYDRREEHIRFEKVDDSMENCISSTIFVPGLNKPYVKIVYGPENDHVDILGDLAHEEGHSISALMNPSRFYDDHIYFTEIESLFFELIGNDFFEKELHNTSFIESSFYSLCSYYYMADEILEKKKIADLYFQNPRKLKNLSQGQKVTLQCIEMGESEIDSDMKYTFSYLVALELYEVYQKDKDLALNLLKRIIQQEKCESEYQTILSSVTPGQSLTKYKKRITKDIFPS